MTDRPHTPESGVSDALTQLSDETARLVRREIDAGRAETVAKLKQNLPAATLLALAAVLSVLSTASAYRWTLRLLERRMSAPVAALVAAIGYGGAAGAAAVVGAGWLREAPKPLPTETVRETTGAVGQVAADVREDTGNV